MKRLRYGTVRYRTLVWNENDDVVLVCLAFSKNIIYENIKSQVAYGAR
jgi:hypothetical protein